MKRPAGDIFIYCDDAAHTERVAVTHFLPDCDGGWEESFIGRPGQRSRESGHTLIGDSTSDDIMLIDPSRDTRSRYRLECRRCRRPVVVREDRLFTVLNGVARQGVSEISISVLAAKVPRS